MRWFRPACPVPPEAKAWIEDRMSWLASQRGLDQFKTCPVILPTKEFFPDFYDGSQETVRALLDRVCGFVGIDPATVLLALYKYNSQTVSGPGFSFEREPFSTAGGYYREHEGKTIVALEESGREDPVSLVAAMAHELCHAYLLGGKRISSEDPDHELLTDLTTVSFGLGVLAANAAIRESYHSGALTYGWRISQHGYLTENDLAYGLAVFAWARGERKPPWARHLFFNVRTLFKQSLRYIWETGDCLFKPEK